MFQRNKTDKKIRFQQQNFQKHLKQARNFKRQPQKIPQGDVKIFFSKIGLSSIWSKIFVALGIGFLIYLVYIPNYFYLKNINLTGLKAGDQSQIVQALKSYLSEKTLIPKANLLLLNKSKVEKFLLDQPSVFQVETIQKAWPNTLNIQVLPRIDLFVIKNQNAAYTISNDGIITSQKYLADLATGTPAGNLKTIVMPGNESLEVGKKTLTEEQLQKLNLLKLQAPQISGSPIQNFELLSFINPDWAIKFEAGWKLNFNSSGSILTTLAQFQTIMLNLSSGDKNRLSYVDLRFLNKAFVCFKDLPCAKPEASLNQATTTPEITPY